MWRGLVGEGGSWWERGGVWREGRGLVRKWEGHGEEGRCGRKRAEFGCVFRHLKVQSNSPICPCPLRLRTSNDLTPRGSQGPSSECLRTAARRGLCDQRRAPWPRRAGAGSRDRWARIASFSAGTPARCACAHSLTHYCRFAGDRHVSMGGKLKDSF